LLIYFSFASLAFMQTDSMINILQATAVNGVLAIASTPSSLRPASIFPSAR
jgi:ribose transport system permease protein